LDPQFLDLAVLGRKRVPWGVASVNVPVTNMGPAVRGHVLENLWRDEVVYLGVA
jgi:hypothetical protein